GRHPHALRVQPREHVPHHAVLARRVHPLQHDQQRLSPLRPQRVLQVGDLQDARRHLPLGIGLAPRPGRLARVVVIQSQLLAAWPAHPLARPQARLLGPPTPVRARAPPPPISRSSASRAVSRSGSLSQIVTWPILRPGRGSLPYRCTCAPPPPSASSRSTG